MAPLEFLPITNCDGRNNKMKMRGSIVATGILAATTLFGGTISQAQTAGSLDDTFGTNGTVTTSLGTNISGIPLAAFEESNGDLLVVVNAFVSNSTAFGGDVELLRYTSAGKLDTTFGNGGVVVTAIPNIFNPTGGVALDSEGNIVIAGTAAPNSSSNETGFGVARLTPNGQLDTTFGSGGTVTTFFGNENERASALLVQPNGKILIAGIEPSLSRKSPVQTALVRYNSNGSLDQTFGSGGIEQAATAIAGPETLALLSNGDYLALAGSAEAEFSSTGTPVSTFTESSPTTTSGFSTTVLQSNGDILVASSVAPPAGSAPTSAGLNKRSTFLNVARFTENDDSDSTFTTTTFPFIPLTSTNFTTVNESTAGGVAVQSNGMIVVAGGIGGTGSNAPGLLGLARLNADGALDTTFGSGGTTSNSVASFGLVLLIQNDGNIVVVGPVAQSGSSELAPSIVVERFLSN